MHVDRYEKIWIWVTIAMLVVFAIATGVSAFGVGIQLPQPEERVDPRLVATPGATSFKEPGLYELAPNTYEAYILATAQGWAFQPDEITVPAGSSVTFYVTSKDIQHGFLLQGTNLNVMIIPGQISTLTGTFEEPGTYNFVCHEYCGLGHQGMFGRLIVAP